MNKSMHLPESIIKSLKKRVRKIIIKNILKTVLFYAVGFGFLFYAESISISFSRENEPFWFSFFFIVILLLPVWLFKFYVFIFRGSFRGTVEEVKDATQIEKIDYNAFFLRGWGTAIGSSDMFIVTIRSKRKIAHRFSFTGAQASFAREYYQIGDEVFYHVLTQCPVNLMRMSETKFCVCCGDCGTESESTCSVCRIPFFRGIKLETSEDMT